MTDPQHGGIDARAGAGARAHSESARIAARGVNGSIGTCVREEARIGV